MYLCLAAPKLIKRKSLKKKNPFDDFSESVGNRSDNADSSSTADTESTAHDSNAKVEIFPPDEKSAELLKQPFLLESDVSVAYWLDFHDLNIHDFIRYKVGELSEEANS